MFKSTFAKFGRIFELTAVQGHPRPSIMKLRAQIGQHNNISELPKNPKVSFLQNLNLNFWQVCQFSSISKHRHIAYQIKGNED